MKKLLLSALLLLSLVSLAPAPADSRPAYCNAALENCATRCGNACFGISIFVDSCVGGCYLGYMLC
jgi:hypothetical protein